MLMALMEAAEHEMVERRILNLNMFRTGAVARMVKELKGRGFIHCDWFYRIPQVGRVRGKLM